MVLFFSALVLASVAAPAAPNAQTATTATGKVAVDLDKVVCRRESIIGSRAKTRRVCMTERERLRLEQGTRDGVDDYIRKSTSGATPGG